MRCKKAKRPFLLLEVMISFVLIVMCVLPLIYPHVALYKETASFRRWEESQKMHQLIFTAIQMKLHRNDLTWQQINSETKFALDKTFLEVLDPSLTLNEKGFYRFKIKRKKTNKNSTQGYYLFEVEITYPEKEKNAVFDLFVERNAKESKE